MQPRSLGGHGKAQIHRMKSDAVNANGQLAKFGLPNQNLALDPRSSNFTRCIASV